MSTVVLAPGTVISSIFTALTLSPASNCSILHHFSFFSLWQNILGGGTVTSLGTNNMNINVHTIIVHGASDLIGDKINVDIIQNMLKNF